ncbi:hypothetical protein ACFW5P_28365 [Streptomyces rochei]|uniref:hypothetical protein n=1 Tax=Streptomyces TaxID=1883 RepID=UPI0036BFC75C
MAHTDRLLERLVNRVNESGELLDITLVIGGAMVSGRLAARQAWMEVMIENLPEFGLGTFRDDFATFTDEMDEQEYLHLSGGKVLFGELAVPPRGGLVRIPITSIDGWMIGRIDISRQ